MYIYIYSDSRLAQGSELFCEHSAGRTRLPINECKFSSYLVNNQLAINKRKFIIQIQHKPLLNDTFLYKIFDTNISLIPPYNNYSIWFM